MTYEKSNSDKVLTSIVTLGCIGSIAATCIGGLVHLRNSIVDSENEIKQQKQDIVNVQAYNPEIGSQLTAFNGVSKLVLNPANHTLTFVAKDKSGDVETCKGNYTVNNNAASLAGSIACTQVLYTHTR